MEHRELNSGWFSVEAGGCLLLADIQCEFRYATFTAWAKKEAADAL